MRAGLPADLDLVFARVLAKSPQDRYRSCQEFSNALRIALDIAAYDPRVLSLTRQRPSSGHERAFFRRRFRGNMTMRACSVFPRGPS